MVWEPENNDASQSQALPTRTPSRGQRRWAWGLVMAVLVLASGFWVAVGADGDGLATYREWELGTDPLRADSDGDGLSDGWEVARGLDPLGTDTDGDGVADRIEVKRYQSDPLRRDTDDDGLEDGDEARLQTDLTKTDSDGDDAPDLLEVENGSDPLVADSDNDGLDDGTEYRLGLDPRSGDTDADGLADADEAAAPDPDCDGDGLHAAADRDDDADGRLDADEETDWRCRPDVDGDGVLDGAEGARSCILVPDCDLDGLLDRVEHEDLEFDPLAPDTFGVGLLDSVVWAFREQGQTPSGDDDGDGIPDGWESSGGLIDWGPYRPQAERTDLLVEFVRVQGPQSHKVASLDFTPAYETVAQAFADQGGIAMQWVETRVVRNQESRPAIIPSFDDPYYADVLARAHHSANPYVLTVVMNPQHDQSQLRHAGIAPIRGMLAAVDYGFFTRMVFEANNQTVTFQPYWESLIAAGTENGQYGRSLTNAGVAANGEFYIRGSDFTAYWTPLWFQTAPRFEFDAGGTVQTEFSHATVQWRELSGVLMHEIGHTLGLCHLELSECRGRLQLSQTDRLESSSMYSASALTQVAYLDAEWHEVHTYLGCPPQGPLVVLAEGGDKTAVFEEKYIVTEDRILNVDSRRCGDHAPIPRAFVADFALGGYTPPSGRLDPGLLDGPHPTYTAPTAMADPGTAGNGVLGLVLFLMVTSGVAVLVHRVPTWSPGRGPWAR